MGGDGGGKLEEGGPVNKNTVEQEKINPLFLGRVSGERQDPRVEMATSCININLPEANTMTSTPVMVRWAWPYSPCAQIYEN